MARDFYTIAARRALSSLRAEGLEPALRALHRQRPIHACALLVGNWAVIAASCWAVGHVSIVAAPLAILVIGWRQRALGNLLHDAAHGALLPGARRNRWLAAALCGLPMLEDFEQYRSCHLRHHAHLGDPARDPDCMPPPPPHVRTPLAFYLYYLTSPAMFRTSVLGNFIATPPRGRLLALAWWAGCLGLVAAIAGGAAALGFAALFVAARATVYHAIRVFAEVSDHVAPSPDDALFVGTRTMPSGGAAALLNPHHDNYHLAHHLFPRVPTFALDRLDALLWAVADYRAAPRFSSYFRGPGSVVRHWVASRGPS